MNFRNAQSTLQGFAKNLEKSIVNPVVGNLSSKLLQSLTDATSTRIKGPDGKNVKNLVTGKDETVENSSIFGKLGGLLGDKKDVPLGSTESKPLLVKVLNLPKPPGIGDGSATAPIGQDNGKDEEGSLGVAGKVQSALASFKSGDYGQTANDVGSLVKSLFSHGVKTLDVGGGALGAPAVTDLSGLGGGGVDLSSLGFARGCRVSGPGTGTSDSIHAMLSHGEHVTNAKQTERWFPLLHAINEGHLDSVQSIAMPSGLAIPRFASGGLVGGAASMGGGTNGSPFALQIHPDMARQTLGDWFQQQLASASATR